MLRIIRFHPPTDSINTKNTHNPILQSRMGYISSPTYGSAAQAAAVPKMKTVNFA